MFCSSSAVQLYDFWHNFDDNRSKLLFSNWNTNVFTMDRWNQKCRPQWSGTIPFPLPQKPTATEKLDLGWEYVLPTALGSTFVQCSCWICSTKPCSPSKQVFQWKISKRIRRQVMEYWQPLAGGNVGKMIILSFTSGMECSEHVKSDSSQQLIQFFFFSVRLFLVNHRERDVGESLSNVLNKCCRGCSQLKVDSQVMLIMRAGRIASILRSW